MLNRLKELIQTFLFDPINKRMEVKQPIKFDSTVSFSDAALEAGDIAVADGKIIIGGAAGKGVAQTPSGDVTITNAGVTTVGAKKVVKGMLSLTVGKVFVGKKTSNDAEEIDISAEGAIVIGQGAGETPAAAVLSGDVTMNKDGVTAIGAGKVTLANHVAASEDGTIAKVVAESNVIGGLPLTFMIPIVAGALGDTDVVMTHKIRVLDAYLILRGAGVATTTLQVKNGANAITNAMDASGSDKALVRAASIDDANYEIAATGTLRVTSATGASQPDALVVVTAIRVA